MVEEIEGLGKKLQVDPFIDLKRARHAEVDHLPGPAAEPLKGSFGQRKNSGRVSNHAV